MRNVLSYPLLTGLVLLAAAGCTGGSQEDPTSSVRIRCSNGQAFCIISCDLGCTQTGCAVSEISENQRLRFKFSDRVDPATVNGASISIRTASGVAPDGDFLVNGSEVTFAPKVRTIAGVSTFGFLRNESYIISLAGGASQQGVRGLTGDSLAQEFRCTVVASRGVLDEDLLPPSATLISPTNLAAAPRNPTVVLRFSELIDTTPLQSSLGPASPIRVVLRTLLPDGACNLDNEGTALEGVPQLSTEVFAGHEVTVVSFQPSVQLPGRSCVTVYVSPDLRDLSGRSAVAAQFQFITEDGVPNNILIREQFSSPSNQEALVSGGLWNSGARPGLIGGDGRHGSFNPAFGSAVGNNTFVWNAGNLTIPASNTPNGQPVVVADGRFFFTDFVLPEGVTLRFTGTTVPQIYVRGQVDIRGTIDVSAPVMQSVLGQVGAGLNQLVSNFNARASTTLVVGQAGGVGGPGGGNGGKGGDECAGNGASLLNDGQQGQSVVVPADHAYAPQAVGMGGLGSGLIPTDGLTTSAGAPFISGAFRDEFSRGGAGGSYLLPGTEPALPNIPLQAVQPVNSPAVPVSPTFALLPYPVVPPADYSSLKHFLVGGSGGGGGGSHPFATINGSAANDRFIAGHGGSGGGGAIAIRCGGALSINAAGVLLARGGDGVFILGDDPTSPGQDTNYGISSPGGGGSGGSVLLQSARGVSVAGVINTRGGIGSRTGGILTAPLNVVSQAGSGASGFYRLEAGTAVTFVANPNTVPTFVEADNVGPLVDRDTASGDLSKWRGTGLIFPPTWQRYELDVDVDGDGTVDVTYTDSGAPGTQKANDPAGPLTIRFQGAELNQSGSAPITGQVTLWYEGIGNAAGSGIVSSPNIRVTGFRFEMLYNRAAFPNQIVRELRVYAQS